MAIQTIRVSMGVRGEKGDSGVLSIYKTFATTAARNAYFTAFPAEKIAGPIILTGSTFQTWNGSAWVNLSLSVVQPQGVANLRDYFGAVGDGATDDTVAFNDAAEALNSGLISALYIPHGHYIVDGEVDPIYLDYCTIYGDKFATLIEKVSGSGTIFTIGSSTERVHGACIGEFRVNCAHASDALTGNIFDFVNAADCFIDTVYAGTPSTGNGIAGLVKFGDAALGTYTSRCRVMNAQVQAHGPAEGTLFDLQWANGTRVHNVTANCFDASVTGGLRGIHIHPVGKDGSGGIRTADSGVWYGVEFNFPGKNVGTVLDIDGTNGGIYNQWFTDCVFDQGTSWALKIHIDSGALAGYTNRINNIFLNNSRAYPTGDGALWVDNTGNKAIGKIKVNNGTLVSPDDQVILVTNGNGKVQLKVNNTDLIDRTGTTERAVIEVDYLDSLIVTGCECEANVVGGDIAFTDFVHITGNTRSFVVTGNDLTRLTGEVINRDTMVTNDTDYRMARDNVGYETYVKRTTTTDATVTNIAAFAIHEGQSLYAEAVISAVQDGGTNRASYKIAATFYRNDGGNTQMQGATTVLYASESNAAWDVRFNYTTEMGVLQVIGVAATTIEWGCEVTLRRLMV